MGDFDLGGLLGGSHQRDKPKTIYDNLEKTNHVEWSWLFIISSTLTFIKLGTMFTVIMHLKYFMFAAWVYYSMVHGNPNVVSNWKSRAPMTIGGIVMFEILSLMISSI